MSLESVDEDRQLREEGVLSNAINNPITMAVISKYVKPDDFLDPDIRRVYERIFLLWDADREIDQRNLLSELIKAQLTTKSVTDLIVKATKQGAFVSSAAHDAAEVARYAALRRIYNSANLLLAEKFNPKADPAVLLAEFEASTSKLLALRQANFITVAEANQMFVDRAKELMVTKAGPGMKSGFQSIDYITGGFRRKGLSLIGANTGCGKSALALIMAYRMAQSGLNVWYVSLEMEAVEFMERLISSITGIPIDRVSKNDISAEELILINGLTPGLRDIPLVIDDCHHETLKSLKAKAKLKKASGLDVIVVDYVQLMESSIRGDRHLQVKAITRGLKLIAKELDVAVIGLSQLNSGSDSQEPKRTDWGESKTIIDDASIAMLIWRPDGNKNRRFIVKVVKGRNTGGTAAIDLDFEGEVMRFNDRDDGNTI